MASFAKIGLNGKVMEVHSLHDDILKDAKGVSSEDLGIKFLENLTGWAVWKQTFTDGTRKNTASKDYTYDENRDAFIPPKPFNSWTLNETTCHWEAPVATPADGKVYTWNEATQQWDLYE